jgi:hypothetical protein
MAMHALVGAVPVPRAAQGSSTAARAGPLRAMRSVASRGVALRQGPARNTAAVRTHGRRPLAVRAAAVGAEEVELDSDEQRIQRAIQIRGNSGKVRPKRKDILGLKDPRTARRPRKPTGCTEPYDGRARVACCLFRVLRTPP